MLVCRNAQRGQAAVDEIKKKTNNANVRLEVVDIARPGEVLAFARRFIEENKRLDVLVNNAVACRRARDSRTNERSIDRTDERTNDPTNDPTKRLD